MRPVPSLDPSALAELPDLDAAVARVEAVWDFQAHPYLRWMAAPSTTREAFCATQVPFRFAVEHFSQALAATLARVPRLETRMALAENVAEEHGHGRLDTTHKHTFLAYLQALGASPEQLASPCPVPVEAFCAAIVDYCLVRSHEESASALGLIEHVYAGIGGTIARTLVDRGWVAPGGQDHYQLHETLDLAHARDLLDLAREAWAEPRLRRRSARGLVLGAHWFWTLYVDLLPAD